MDTAKHLKELFRDFLGLKLTGEMAVLPQQETWVQLEVPIILFLTQ